MTKYFTHHPLSGKSITLVTSCFSHYSLLHLGFNMMALNSLGTLIHNHVLSSPEHFLAAYLGCGVAASAASHLFSNFMSFSSLFSSSSATTRIIKGSVGASGAIWGLMVMFALLSPDSQAGILFIPGIQFKMNELVPALAALDLVGLIRGWQMFDHAAHLGGALAGYLWWTYGRAQWVSLQKRLDEDRLKKRSNK